MENKINTTSQLTFLERIESLKAGILSGSIAFLTFSLLIGFNILILANQFEVIEEIQISFDIRLIIRGAIAFISGFLFGVTYRYVVRSDHNPHLNSGAVLAFGLVRGLGELDGGLNTSENGWFFVVVVAESILLFAAARIVLDLALKQGWLKTFNSNSNWG
ncbi:hypothetical protein M595_4988 [Lyngbya aestuarii BL J]|uniref:Uncharacterized protein n=1 Tax=Lyngbya aestuarii BL J TaxID=1348334 RepID=U7QB67_9CYAN|nr:hypothetical protein [Lyngbya aestuarii]ERT05068.1 hypothetical protein M595_4988 [Lyngbya aestuarii BL J]